MYTRIVSNVWSPLPYKFQREIHKATDEAFMGRNMICTASGETVLFEDVFLYNRRAEGPLAYVFHKLDSISRPDIVEIIQELYPKLMPYFIGCGTANPVHHIAYVMQFMITILIGEENKVKFGFDEKKVGMLAALFHDAAIGRSKLPKITEIHIKDKVNAVMDKKMKLAELQQYLKDAVKARQEHMEGGAVIAQEMLKEKIEDQEIQEITKIIRNHDNPKIPLAYKVMRIAFNNHHEYEQWCSGLKGQEQEIIESLLSEKGENFVIKIDKNSKWLLQYHHEADLLWMLTQDGILADLARFSPAEYKTPQWMLEHNVETHLEELELNKDLLCGGQQHADNNSNSNMVFRSNTGYLLSKYLYKHTMKSFA